MQQKEGGGGRGRLVLVKKLGPVYKETEFPLR